MLSTITKVKNFGLLKSHFYKKTELLIFIKCKKTFSTSTVPLFYKYSENEVVILPKENTEGSKNLGKIVCLSPEEVQMPSENDFFKDNIKGRKKSKEIDKPKRKSDNSKNIQKKEKLTAEMSVSQRKHLGSEEMVVQSEERVMMEEPDEFFEEDEVQGTVQQEGEEKKTVKPPLEKESFLFRRYMSSLKSKSKREKEKKIIIDGKRLVYDAICAGYIPQIIFFSRYTDIQDFALPEKVKLKRVSYKDFQLWSDTVTPQGVIGIFDIPKLEQKKEDPNSLPLTIICDNIRDPGNMGTILRLAAGVGCRKLILTKGCVDIWESKILRAGAGAHFRLPVVKNLEWNEIEKQVKEGSKIFLADYKPPNEEKKEAKLLLFKSTNPKSDSIPSLCYDSVDFRNGDVVIVVGGETTGVSEKAVDFAIKRQGIRVFVPMNNEIESLNTGVALGILSYEVRRQIRIDSSGKFERENIPANECSAGESTERASEPQTTCSEPSVEESTGSGFEPQSSTLSESSSTESTGGVSSEPQTSESSLKESTEGKSDSRTAMFSESSSTKSTEGNSLSLKPQTSESSTESTDGVSFEPQTSESSTESTDGVSFEPQTSESSVKESTENKPNSQTAMFSESSSTKSTDSISEPQPPTPSESSSSKDSTQSESKSSVVSFSSEPLFHSN